MKLPQRAHVPFLLLVAAATLAAAWLQSIALPPLQRAELALQDGFARIGARAPRDPRLVFLAVDTASASLDQEADLSGLWDLSTADAESARGLQLMAHQWPWSREIHALVLDRLVRAGAAAVVFDFTFPKPSPNDEPFRAALERHRERVAVVGNITEDTGLALDGGLPAFNPPTGALIPETSPRDPRIGYDNFRTDFDGVIRRAHYRWALQYGVWAGEEEHSVAARALERAGLGATVPGDRDLHRFRFAGPPGTFAPRSIFEIFVPEFWRRNYGGGAFFRDKIVVIGAAGNWQHDEHRTPFDLMPGAELHLNAINAAIHSAFLRETPPWVDGLLVCAGALLAFLARRLVGAPLLRFGIQALGTLAWLGAAFLCFDRVGLVIPSCGPLFAFHFAGIGALVMDIATERREKALVRRTLERYVSRNVVSELMAHPEDFTAMLGGEERQCSILFSDIRGFSRAAARMNSTELVAQLNEYFAAMVECVFRHGGTLDKFIGDAVMAVWGNTRSDGIQADARNAVACASDMLIELEKLNGKWIAQGRPPLRIGIGINAGFVVVGNIGSPHRMEFTVIGDVVNVAWRLQERTKEGDAQLLIGDPVVSLLGGNFRTERCGELYLPDHDAIPFSRLIDRSAVAAEVSP